jgi:hypothetical protein
MNPGLDDLPDEFDRAALVRCIQVFNEIIEKPERVRTTVTSEFVDAVRMVHEDKEYADAYEQDRPLGFAMAKTIVQSDGSVDLIVDSRVFHADTPAGVPEELFEHEAHHVAISERGETLSDVRIRHQGASFPVYSDLIAMAGVACEEFRIEGLLRRKRQSPSGGHLSGFEKQARTFYREGRDACQAYQRDLDVEAVARAVLDAFHGLATSSAYVAAELLAAGKDAADLEFSEAIDAVVLGERWRDVLVALQQLPLADIATDRAELDEHAFQVAERLSQWLKHIGFTVEAVDEGTDFRILRPVRWALPIRGL